MDELQVRGLVIGHYAQSIPGGRMLEAGAAEIASFGQWKATAWTWVHNPRQFGMALIAEQGMALCCLVAEQTVPEQWRIVLDAA